MNRLTSKFFFTLLFQCLLITLIVPYSQSANKPTCNICKKKITGQYYNYSAGNRKATICSNCKSKYPHCDSCNIPSIPGGLKTIGSKRICHHCQKIVKVCVSCKNIIQGKFWQFEGRPGNFCNSCYITLPKCTACGVPIKATDQSYSVHGQQVCSLCMKHGGKCNACDLPIFQKYFTYKHIQGKFCQHCEKNRHHCHTCGVPVGNKYWDLFDSRVMCESCHETAVYKMPEAKAILRDVERILKRKFGMEVKKEFDFQLVNLSNYDNDSPIDKKELGLYKEAMGKRTIYILTTLPRPQFYETVAHELTHAWQSENAPKMRSNKELMEGFPQWIAAQVLEYKGYDRKLAHLEERTDFPYGTGYKQVQKIAKKRGKQNMINHFQTQYKPPTLKSYFR